MSQEMEEVVDKPQVVERGLRHHKSKLKSRARALLLALMLVGSIGAGIEAITPTAAFAGTNGQQIDVGTYHSYSVRICGTNQNNSYTCWWGNTPNYWTPVYGWWWKGTVQVLFCYSYNLTGCYAVGYWNVPAAQSSNWVYIQYN